MTSPPRPTRVLIVDDSPLLLAQLAEHFQLGGFEADVAEGARVAVRRARHSVPAYDLYVADVRMPELSGYELVRALRRERQGDHAPIIIYSSLGGAIDIVEGLDAGADDHLAKGSVDASELVVRAQNLLNLRREHSRRAHGQAGVASQEVPRIVIDGIAAGVLDERVLAALNDRDDLEVTDSATQASSHGSGGCATVRLIPFGKLDHGANLAEVVAIDDAPTGERRRAAFEAGVEDYLSTFLSPAEFLARLLSVVRRNRRWAAVSAQPRHQLVEAMTDLDTGLYNRSYLLEHLRIALGRTQRYTETLALVLVEVGHGGASEPLGASRRSPSGETRALARALAVKLKESTRVTDLLCRLGPTTYAALLPRTGQVDALVVAKRIHAALADTVSTDGAATQGAETHAANCAVGVAFAPRDGAESLDVMAQAEGALASASRSGGGVATTLGGAGPEVSEELGVDMLEGRLAWMAATLEKLLRPGLGSPINGIAAAAQVLERRTGETDPRAPMIREISARIGELRDVLRDAQRRLRPDDEEPPTS